MAVPTTKRRKLSHSPTPESEDKSADETDNTDLEDDAQTSATRTDGHKDQASKAQKSREGKRKLMHNPLLDGGVYNGEIYKSNIFKLQLDRLLRDSRQKSSARVESIDKALRMVKQIIENASDTPPVSIIDAEKELKRSHGVAIPFPSPRPPKDAKYKLEFRKPSHINVIGSYPAQLATQKNGQISVDLMISMPTALFQDKDFLNYRYFYKRAYYLACVAAILKGDKTHKLQVSYEMLHGNQLLPVVIVHTNETSAPAGFCIRILPSIAESVFSAEKTQPDRNCVRPQPGLDSEKHKLEPTPFYNASLRIDSSMTHYLKLIHRASTICDGFRDACSLGRLWLQQRNLSSDIHSIGFGNFEWAAIVATLLLTEKSPSGVSLSPGYSSYQLFKATLQFLSSRDISRNPFLTSRLECKFPKNGTPVFFDSQAGINLLFQMSPWSYKTLRDEAALTVKMLGDNIHDNFEATFKIKVDPLLLKHDIVMNVPVGALSKAVNSSSLDPLPHLFIHKVYSLLVRGLGDRVSSIAIYPPHPSPWTIDSARVQQYVNTTLDVGFSVHPVHIARTIDRGPSAEDKQDAAAFRKFWGEKAELRRFKDGSIVETLEWSAKPESGTILEQIVLHILERHVGKTVATEVKFSGENFGKLLPGSAPHPSIAPFKPIMTAFSTLERDLRGLDELPLQFRHVLAASSGLSYSSVMAPLSKEHDVAAQPLDVIIEFEGSGRWPDEIPAIQKTKIAFLLKIGELFEQKADGTTTRLGLDNQENNMLNQAYLDIIYSTSAAFRLRIRLDREQATLERVKANKLTDAKQREIYSQALAVYKRHSLVSPSHVQALQTLSTRYPALSPSIRLVKRWFAAHLLTSHIPETVIELLVVRAFLQPFPWDTPSSVSTGFVRTLYFLSRWDWREDPLIVDLSGDMTSDEFEAIEADFKSLRAKDPSMNKVVLFAASSVDRAGTTWTDQGSPPRVAASRMTALAKAATQAVLDPLVKLNVKSLFTSSLKDYDFVIHLHAKYTRAGREKSVTLANGQFKNLQLQAASLQNTKNIGYDPVAAYVEDLKSLYGSCAVFFHDNSNGGRVIAGLWNPAVVGRKHWRAMMLYSTIPKIPRDDENGMSSSVNVEAILSEMARLGGDMVSKIEQQKTFAGVE
ncbi:pre-rRNA processing protein-like protein Utp22 [Pseudovirgaria hyperparasitica]|uniref:U3 small nucleolar RNA-associated protein 22 n=1 Tax=Pseudovirgaria hyperparasitica TaxID=470096 RepID=A0A6A6WFP8_9PEZI|nr:pre-rRNA processing protein-like protein Utp22 [Pseudovirgaria hyperparasitica]KAF2760726.1 pre-rRNA processing protein-like protein Utp22 [Pseudovirgaria hyperparasitica]